MSKHTLMLALMVAGLPVYADLNIPGIAMHSNASNALVATDKTLAKTGLSVNEDDMTAGQDLNTLKLDPLQLHEAKVWGLTEDEEKRYVFLMQNKSAIYYKGLRQTPVDVLGLNARSEEEREHFATLSAAQEAQKVSKNIAWNNAFYKAYNQIFAGVPVVGDFDASPYAPSAYKPIILNSGDTLYLFIKTDDAIKTILLSLIEAINTSANTRLHIMLLECDDIGIQLWANQNQIPKTLVSSGNLTLNHGELSYEALNVAKKKTPLLLLARNGASSVVDLGVF